ncbi:MAG: molecular chaperone TorD family protein [Kiloniellales bacterium]
MSLPHIHGQALPAGDSPERAAAKETLWRLSAAAFSHPNPELQEAFASGRFHQAFQEAWWALTRQAWPESPASPDFATLEAGYIIAFLHGRKGKPLASLLAGEYEALLAGHTRPVFMLNVTAFYRHFGLQAATQDEGHHDEPDHLASMLEFLAVLSHLEARALARDQDASPYRRAQRDFLRRHLLGLLQAIRERLREQDGLADLDPTLRQLVLDLPDFAERLATELEARVGRYRDPDAEAGSGRLAGQARPDARTDTGRVVDQDLWG